jgi:hypothetical protein
MKARLLFFTLLMGSIITSAQVEKDSVVIKNTLVVKDSVVVKEVKLIQPPYLQKGDTIAIVAPAGILTNRKEVLNKAKELAESWGLHVV